MSQRRFNYSDGVDPLVGELFLPQSVPAPAVLVAPAFGGAGDVELDTAKALADLGYVALVVDYYGHGKRARGPDEAQAWMATLNADRSILIRRMQAALAAVKALSQVDKNRVGAMGFCLGGKAVLDLARSGADFCAAVSVHGVFDRPPGVEGAIKPAILALHGWDDPLAPPEAVNGLAAELTAFCDDWQILALGHTGHAFTNPKAQNAADGMMYSARATQRSWRAITAHLADHLLG